LHARTWTQAATDRTLEADLIRVTGLKVELRLKDGRVATVPIATLSVDDQEYIREHLEGETKPGADDWPQWRGANQDGISPATDLLEEWPEEGPEEGPEKLWSYEEAGNGYSSFSIVDGKLYTLGTRDDELVALALNAETGAELWAVELVPDEQEGYRTGWGHGPRSTPTFSDGNLYILGPNGGLFCIRAEDGSRVWDVNILSEYAGEAGGWGYSASPLVDGNRVVVAPGGDEASVVALDKQSGSLEWQVDIPDAGKAEYATILDVTLDERPQYVKLFMNLLVGLDPSTGEMLWQSDWPAGRTAVIPTPIVDEDYVYITSGYGAGSKLVEVSGGTATDIWESDVMKNHHGGVIKIGDYVYGFSDGVGLVCQSWKSGDLVWREKDDRMGKLIKGAIHAADGHLYCLNEGDGTVTLVEANPEEYVEKGQFTLEPQSRIRSPRGKIWTHPVVLNGKLYLRDQEYIHCYDVEN